MRAVILGMALLLGVVEGGAKVVGKFGEDPWSKELKKEVWETSKFQVLLEGAGIEREMGEGVGEEVPLLVLVSDEGEEVGRLGFLLVPPEKYVDLIKEMSAIDVVCRNLEEMEAGRLLYLYRKAEMLQMRKCARMILEEGLKKDTGVDFLVAQYAGLIDAHPRRARSVKEEIRKRKSGDVATEWELALIALRAREGRGMEEGKVVLPVKKFLKRFGEEHTDYVWKCHLVLAEFYRRMGNEEKWKGHAGMAAEGAPENLKKIIESS